MREYCLRPMYVYYTPLLLLLSILLKNLTFIPIDSIYYGNNNIVPHLNIDVKGKVSSSHDTLYKFKQITKKRWIYWRFCTIGAGAMKYTRNSTMPYIWPIFCLQLHIKIPSRDARRDFYIGCVDTIIWCVLQSSRKRKNTVFQARARRHGKNE